MERRTECVQMCVCASTKLHSKHLLLMVTFKAALVSLLFQAGCAAEHVGMCSATIWQATHHPAATCLGLKLTCFSSEGLFMLGFFLTAFNFLFTQNVTNAELLYLH